MNIVKDCRSAAYLRAYFVVSSVWHYHASSAVLSDSRSPLDQAFVHLLSCADRHCSGTATC